MQCKRGHLWVETQDALDLGVPDRGLRNQGAPDLGPPKSGCPKSGGAFGPADLAMTGSRGFRTPKHLITPLITRCRGDKVLRITHTTCTHALHPSPRTTYYVLYMHIMHTA